MEVLLLIILMVIVALVMFFKTKKNIKSAHVKKSEIIENYEENLRLLLKESNNLPEDKIKYLKQASSELGRNIFFDVNEVKAIISKLASM